MYRARAPVTWEIRRLRRWQWVPVDIYRQVTPGLYLQSQSVRVHFQVLPPVLSGTEDGRAHWFQPPRKSPSNCHPPSHNHHHLKNLFKLSVNTKNNPSISPTLYPAAISLFKQPPCFGLSSLLARVYQLLLGCSSADCRWAGKGIDRLRMLTPRRNAYRLPRLPLSRQRRWPGWRPWSSRNII